jgi:MFS family permease
MVTLILVGVVLVGILCALAYTLATYALPFMLGLAAARLAYATGAGLIGSALAGLVVGAVAFGVLAFLFSTLRSPHLRFAVMIVFVAPAAIAGYALVLGIARQAVPSEIWRQIFCVMGGVTVGVSAWLRLAAPVDIGAPAHLEVRKDGHSPP